MCAKLTMPSGMAPPLAMMARIFGGSAPGVAICSAAEPDRPCAQTLPRPSSDAARERAVVDALVDAASDSIARSTAEKTRVKPQLTHDDAIANAATRATAPRGERGDAREGVDGAAHRPRGGDDVAGDDDERHLHGEGEQIGEARAPGADQSPAGTPMASPATKTSTVAASAKTKASGSQRSAKRVSASATRDEASVHAAVYHARRRSVKMGSSGGHRKRSGTTSCRCRG